MKENNWLIGLKVYQLTVHWPICLEVGQNIGDQGEASGMTGELGDKP